MADYNLTAVFTDEQLANIFDTNSSVIVAKPAASGPIVAWQVFTPMQTNQLEWEEEYGIYTSTAALVHGAELTQLSNVPVGAGMNKLYTLEPNGSISGPGDDAAANSFSLLNKYAPQPFMTTGLFQDATVNGVDIIGNAISAAPVLLASTAVMTPYTTVYIWIQSEVESNTVVTTVTSPMTKLTFGGGVNSISVSYDAPTGKFLQISK